jgi:hypothetical protein
MPFSEMWRLVDLVRIDVWKERIAYIFRVEKPASEEPALSRWLQTVPPVENTQLYKKREGG